LTLSRKLKLRSRKKTFRKFGQNLKDPLSGTQLTIPTTFKKQIRNYKINVKRGDPLKILD